MKDPPSRPEYQDQAADDSDECHARLSVMELASWMATGLESQ